MYNYDWIWVFSLLFFISQILIFFLIFIDSSSSECCVANRMINERQTWPTLTPQTFFSQCFTKSVLILWNIQGIQGIQGLFNYCFMSPAINFKTLNFKTSITLSQKTNIFQYNWSSFSTFLVFWDWMENTLPFYHRSYYSPSPSIHRMLWPDEPFV